MQVIYNQASNEAVFDCNKFQYIRTHVFNPLSGCKAFAVNGLHFKAMIPAFHGGIIITITSLAHAANKTMGRVSDKSGQDHIQLAAAREKRLKEWKRQWKIDLIQKMNPDGRIYTTTSFSEWPPRSAPRGFGGGGFS